MSKRLLARSQRQGSARALPEPGPGPETRPEPGPEPGPGPGRRPGCQGHRTTVLLLLMLDLAPECQNQCSVRMVAEAFSPLWQTEFAPLGP